MLLCDPEVNAALQEALPRHDGSGVLRLAREVYAAVPADKRDVVDVLLPPSVRPRVIQALHGARASTLRIAMKLLRNSVHLAEVYAGWTEEDWTRTVADSNANTLRLLTFDLRHWNLPGVTARIAQELARVDLNSVLSDPQVSLRRDINGLLGNIRTDAPEELPAFLGNLARSDLSLLVADAPLNDIAWLLNIANEHAPPVARTLICAYRDLLMGRVAGDCAIDSLHLLLAVAYIDWSAAVRIGARAVDRLADDVSPRHRLGYLRLLELVGRPSADDTVITSPGQLDELLVEAQQPSIAALAICQTLWPIADGRLPLPNSDIVALAKSVDLHLALLQPGLDRIPQVAADLSALRARLSGRRPRRLKQDDTQVGGALSACLGSSGWTNCAP